MLLLLLLLGNLCFLFKKPLTSADLILSGEILPPGGAREVLLNLKIWLLPGYFGSLSQGIHRQGKEVSS